MNFDLRFPIGFLFSFYGAILTVYGAFGNSQVYERSLGININLDWGIVLLVFGAFMLLLAFRGQSRAKQASPKK